MGAIVQFQLKSLIAKNARNHGVDANVVYQCNSERKQSAKVASESINKIR